MISIDHLQQLINDNKASSIIDSINKLDETKWHYLAKNYSVDKFHLATAKQDYATVIKKHALLNGYTFVIHNGHLLAGHHTENVIVTDLKHYQDKQAIAKSCGFQALNYALHDGGICLDIPDNLQLTTPIYILYLHEEDKPATMSHPRSVVTVGKNSKATIIEHQIAAGNDDCLHNLQSTITCQDNANLDYYVLQDNPTCGMQVHDLTFNLQKSSNLAANSFACGAGINKLAITANLQQENCNIDLQMLQCSKQQAIYDISLAINHLVANCTSNTLARGIAYDKSTATLTGNITIHPHASASTANLQTKNLLLSSAATINSCPQLEVYNDDVVCSHGSCCGYLDEDALFYMQSRGIDLEVAKNMLISAFFAPIWQNIKHNSFSNIIRSKLDLGTKHG